MATALLPARAASLLDMHPGTPVGTTVTLALLLSPLRGADGQLHIQRTQIAPGSSVADALPPGTWERVIWNGALLDAWQWKGLVLKPGDELLLIPRWAEVGFWSVAIPIIVGILISVGTTALTYLLFPPNTPHLKTHTDEQTFSFEGIRTAIGPGNVIPVIYGTHRVGGQLLQATVDQLMTVVDDGATQPGWAVTNATGGDYNVDVVANSVIVLTVPSHGVPNNATVFVSGVEGKAGANGTWKAVIPDGNTVVLGSSWGVDPNPYTGGGLVSVIDSGQRVVTALADPPMLSLLLAIGEGPVAHIQTETILINGQPITNFPTVGVYVRAGTPDQAPIPEFNESRNTFADGREMFGAPRVYTTTQAIQAFTINLAFNEGLFHLRDNGEKETNVTTIRYRFRVHPAGAWSPYSQYDIAGDRTSAVRVGIRREGLGLAIYDIEVESVNARHTDDIRSKWKPTLESVTEIQYGTNSYPNTALLGIRSLAIDGIQGSLPNITVVVQGKQVRLGTFDDVLTWSDDPAWCVMDFMTNQRYGLGIPDDQIDLLAFYVWSGYNNQIIQGERRHTFNYVLDRDQRAQPLLLEMMGGSRTLLIKTEGLWRPLPTQDQTPVQLLTWSTCSNLALDYRRDPDRVTVVEARFANEEDDYEQDVLTWPAFDEWPANVSKFSQEIRGVTKPTRIMRALQFELNRRRFERLSISMDCTMDAVALAPHDIFRFAHPLPGWGVSGRLQAGSTAFTLVLDEDLTFEAGQAYHVYIRHTEDSVEVRDVVNPGAITTRTIVVVVPLSFVPTPRLTHYAIGRSSPNEMALRLFRVVRMQRKADNTVHIEAIAHNPSIYDEAIGIPLPPASSLFNPLGPPPPLIMLIALEVTRIQASGASLRVVNLSWNVAALSSGFAPYGGAMILRRTILAAGQGGMGEAGGMDAGALQDPNDPNVGFVALTRVTGHVLDFDDYTSVTGATYVYRVVPLSRQGVPNNVGFRDVAIHITGPTTPGYFPGTPRNLRLRGQAVGVTLFEGRDVHLQWDPVADSALFSETFFVQDYIVQVWAPAQLYLLRGAVVSTSLTGTPIEFTYTLEQNGEDQVRAGMPGARRDLQFFVWARTNTGRISLDPASITVVNPPPDMGDFLPDTTALFEAALINFNQFVEPRDFHHYEVHLDTVNPPAAIYQDVSIAFRKLAPTGLTAGVTYYTYILPYDTFGPGIQSQTASFIPVALTADSLDTTPPAMPTGLTLSTGNTINPDGTVASWVRANWTAGVEPDLAGYEVQFRTTISPAPSSFQVGRVTEARLETIPGNIGVTCRIAAFDKFHNVSAFTTEVGITTASDTVAPGLPIGLTAFGSFKAIALYWTPPIDLDYVYAEVWASTTNNLALATNVGAAYSPFTHEGLVSGQTWYYWLRSVDTSGNRSAFTPGPLAGVSATTALTTSADIGNLSITETKIANDSISTPKLQANSVDANKVTTGELITLGAQIRSAIITDAHITQLSANKITAGTIQVAVALGVGGNIFLDGTQRLIYVTDENAVTRVLIGKLGALASHYGMQIFNSAGQTMWNFTDGAQTPGIADNAITASKITAGTIVAGHLRTDTAVITVAAQIANAIIGDAHITQLSASKIAAGQISVQVAVGASSNLFGSNIFIDGVNNAITIFDEATTPRVQLGRLNPAAYGLMVWNAAGQLMWNFTDGAQTPGIADNAVTSTKIGFAQITTAHIGTAQIVNAHIGNLEVDSAKIANLTVGTQKITDNAVTESLQYNSVGGLNTTTSELEIASVTFPLLNAGDQVWLVGVAVCTSTGGTLQLRLRQDSAAGGFLHGVRLTALIATGLTTQAVFTAGSTLVNKKFVLSLVNSTTSDNVGADNIALVGLRRQK